MKPVNGAEVVPEPEAVDVLDAARLSGLGRTFLYRAMHESPDYRGGLPFLPSVKIGRRRLLRLATLRTWLAEIERSA